MIVRSFTTGVTPKGTRRATTIANIAATGTTRHGTTVWSMTSTAAEAGRFAAAVIEQRKTK
jgi:hypothetical protein